MVYIDSTHPDLLNINRYANSFNWTKAFSKIKDQGLSEKISHTWEEKFNQSIVPFLKNHSSSFLKYTKNNPFLCTIIAIATITTTSLLCLSYRSYYKKKLHRKKLTKLGALKKNINDITQKIGHIAAKKMIYINKILFFLKIPKRFLFIAGLPIEYLQHSYCYIKNQSRVIDKILSNRDFILISTATIFFALFLILCVAEFFKKDVEKTNTTLFSSIYSHR